MSVSSGRGGSGTHAQLHCWINLQRGKKQAHPSLWDGDPGSPDPRGWAPTAGREGTPGSELLWRWRSLPTSLTLWGCCHLPIFCLSRNKFPTFCILLFCFVLFWGEIFLLLNNLFCYGSVQGPVRVMVNGNCSGSEDASYVTLPNSKCCSHSVIRRKWLS